MDRRGEVPAGKQPWFGMPLFSWHRGQFTGYSPIRQYIESMARFPDAPRLSNAQREALDVYYDICEEERFCLKLHFEPGDMPVPAESMSSSTRARHSSTGPKCRMGGHKRHLIRMWLSLPDGRLLPPRDGGEVDQHRGRHQRGGGRARRR